MSKKLLANLALIVSLLGAGQAISVFGQKESCAVQIIAYNFDDELPIAEVSITATNLATKEVFQSVIQNNRVFLSKLAEGEYKLAASKTGYQKSVVKYTVACSSSEKGVKTSIPLVTGDSSATVTVDERMTADRYRSVIESKEVSGTENSSVAVLPPKTTISTIPSISKAESLPPLRSFNGEIVSGGILNGRAITLIKPEYPAAARQVRAAGAVLVQVTVDEAGHVVSAEAVSGHPLLRAASVKATKETKFPVTYIKGESVRVMGVIVYNFVP